MNASHFTELRSTDYVQLLLAVFTIEDGASTSSDIQICFMCGIQTGSEAPLHP
jgi:hypothetical protein